jgi:hypothetical protein
MGHSHKSEVNQNSAKVGGLVGKVLEIDEKTRFKHDYVRAQIACRDITKVPRTTESTLGIHLHDFHFEREVDVEGPVKVLSSGIKITDKDQPPPPKKFRIEDQSESRKQDNSSAKSSGKQLMLGTGHEDGKKQNSTITMSAPPKLGGKSTSIGKQFNQSSGIEEDGEKVHIPDHFDDSDSDSESLSDKI